MEERKKIKRKEENEQVKKRKGGLLSGQREIMVSLRLVTPGGKVR